jgi:hypothetical protein
MANDTEVIQMGKVFQRIIGLWKERRHHNIPVAVERRSQPTRREAKARVADALEDLERTVTNYRPDNKEFSANDVQQEVQFTTFRAICRFKLKQGDYNLCRNPAHEAANSGIAKCEEQVCPFMRVQRTPA